MANSQTLNRYSYVLNNPTNASDPTGHQCVGNPGECLQDNKTKGAGFTGGDDNNSKNKKKGCGGNYAVNCNGDPKHILTEEDDLIGPAPKTSPIDDIVQSLEFGLEADDLIDLVEDGIQWGRPAYKQVKYAITLGPVEWVADGLLQAYDDRNKDLTPWQRLGRAGVRTFESFLIDGASDVVGLSSAAALQASVPVPVVSAGVGYVAGSYSTSVILDNVAKQKNDDLFSFLGLGGP